MDVTIEMIAEKAQVSRGTVDRVIHNRGRVNPETAERVRNIMEELNYQTNSLGRAFALSRQKIKIGVLVSFKEQDFQTAVLRGVQDGVIYAEQFGFEVLTECADADDYRACRRIIKRFREEKVSGIALKGVTYEDIQHEIKEMRDAGVKIVTFNDDMDAKYRDCFVGQDHRQSGQCAAFLMKEICHAPGEILVVGVSPQHKASADRIESFCSFLARESGGLEVSTIRYCHGKNETSYEIARAYMEQASELKGVFVSGAGLSGVCRAVFDWGGTGKIKVIGFDTIQPNIQFLKQEVVQFLIDQNPYQQGYLPISLLTESLFYNRGIQKEYYNTGIEIKSKYNL